MAKRENPPFARGEFGTAYSDPETADVTGNQHMLGMEFEFEDVGPPASGESVGTHRTNTPVVCRVVQNVAGSALLPAKFAKMNVNGTTVGAVLNKCAGYATVGDPGGVVDEFLPAAGAGNGTLFWLVVQGPTKVTCDSGASVPIAALSLIMPAAANGTFVAYASTATQTALVLTHQGCLGRLCENATVAGSDYLVDLKRSI